MGEKNERSLMRAVVRRVHPDLFSQQPYECAKNSEALKALNAYADAISKGQVLSAQSKTLLFYVKEPGSNGEETLQKIEAELPGNGSLYPLFYAFGLITREELLEGQNSYGSNATDTNFLQWLQETVHEAVRAANYHESLKDRIRELRTAIESKYNIAKIELGGEYALGSSEQLQQLDSLKVLDTAMALHGAETANGKYSSLSGLTLRLYHPDVTPIDTYLYTDDSGSVASRTDTMRSHVGDDGVLHLVADRATIRASFRSFDLHRAQVLTRLSRFWHQRVQRLTPPLVDLLHVDNVWPDTRNEIGSQKFVLWAGAILEKREEFAKLLPEDGRFSFSILVHCDATGPMVEFLASSCVLQVRADCPPQLLLEYLGSEAARLADVSAASASSSREIEEDLLDNVREALGAKHVIRVCSMLEQDKVLEGARRLLENAESITQTVNLTGASIALDDCYEVWESGFISIPYDFQISDLEPQLQRMLGSTSSAPGSGGGGGSTLGSIGGDSSAERYMDFGEEQGYSDDHSPAAGAADPETWAGDMGGMPDMSHSPHHAAQAASRSPLSLVRPLRPPALSAALLPSRHRAARGRTTRTLAHLCHPPLRTTPASASGSGGVRSPLR